MDNRIGNLIHEQLLKQINSKGKIFKYIKNPWKNLFFRRPIQKDIELIIEKSDAFLIIAIKNNKQDNIESSAWIQSCDDDLKNLCYISLNIIDRILKYEKSV